MISEWIQSNFFIRGTLDIDSFTASLAMMIAYGHQITSDDPIVQAAIKSIEMIGKSTFPGAAAVNAFPSCERFLFKQCKLMKTIDSKASS